MQRRDILKGIAALPALGIELYGASATMINPPRLPRNLLQIGFSTPDLLKLKSKYAKDIDTLLKAENLIPEDAVLEKMFDCCTQDVVVFRWWHPDFQPVVGFDTIFTVGPSDDWREILGI